MTTPKYDHAKVEALLETSLDQFVGSVARHTPGVRRAWLDALCRATLTVGDLSSDGDAAVYRLELAWYESIAAGAPDYGLYSDPDYFADLWACWRLYSRKYLVDLVRPLGEGWGSVYDLVDAGPDGVIVDLGCGTGYTTSILATMFPDREVFGTQLPGPQWDMASAMGDRYGFTVSEKPPAMECALLFASEYFEHILEPVADLDEVLGRCKPKRLLLASTFTGDAMGHFDEYVIDGETVPCRRTAKMFNQELRRRGYEGQATPFWNSRPSYWVRYDS